MRVRRLGDQPVLPANEEQVAVSLPASTAERGLFVWVAAGVLTHLTIRFVERWLGWEK